MAGKIQGPGGLGQWDTGTANRDIRASIPSSSSSGGGGTYTTLPASDYTGPTTPTVRKKSRNKGRSKGRNKRR